VVGRAGEGAVGLLVRCRGQSPGLMDGDGGQPAEAARVERDVGALQQRGPCHLAGIREELVTDVVDVALDRALKPVGVGDEERADVVVAALVVPVVAWPPGCSVRSGPSGAGLLLCASTSLPGKVKARPGGARSDSSGSPSGPAAGRRQAVPLRKRARCLH